MRRVSLLLLILVMFLCEGFLKRNKFLLMKVEGPKRRSKLGYNCIYNTERDGEKRVYAYAFGSYSIQCYSVPDGKAIFKIRRVGGKNGYFPGGDFSIIGDINRDGFKEIATPEVWLNKELLIFSGKDGTLLKRILPSEPLVWRVHLPTYDHDKDGIDDFFVAGYNTLFLLSGKDMEPIRKFTSPEFTNIIGIMNAPDLDNDGRGDILLLRWRKIGSIQALIFTYVSSQKCNILKSQEMKLKNNRYIKPRRNNTPLLLSDIDGDNFPEVVSTTLEKHTFKGETYRGNILVCFSSSNGSEIWRVRGWKLPRSENLQFNFVSKIVYPDLNGDGVEDIIVAWMGQYFKKKDLAAYLLIFSGKDGKLIKKRRMEEIKGCLPMLYKVIPDIDGDGKGEILAGSMDYDAGKSKEDAGGIFIISSRLFTS